MIRIVAHSSLPVRTRFAPSPTGYLHIGGARTALFSWAYARKNGGTFVLRIEDTDTERSTAASTQAILDAMQWLNIDYDEGPFYQMQRLDRYREVCERLVAEGKAYPCYASKDELDAMREQQRARGDKPRYDGRWRPENARGRTPPAGVLPVIRFRNPDDGVVTWDDLVKGPISFSNEELDDLVIMRADGVPTYNFGVVVDDCDMNITHVIRGDDHVNNTPRQINIYRALGAPLPSFGHVPMILGEDGERLSKRHGAVSVMQYLENGYLPEALNNFLSRLGWAHGDDEIFSMKQFVEWFDLRHISRSPARFNAEKLLWLNAQYLKGVDEARLAALMRPFLEKGGCDAAGGPPGERVVALLKERVSTVEELADAAMYFYRRLEPSVALRDQHYAVGLGRAMDELRQRFADIDWNRVTIQESLKQVAAAHGLKMPRLAMPLRVIVTGEAQTPAIDAVLEVLGRGETLARMDAERACLPD